MKSYPKGNKPCSICRIVKKRIDYVIRKKSKDGVTSACKACIKIDKRHRWKPNTVEAKEYFKWREENTKKIKEEKIKNKKYAIRKKCTICKKEKKLESFGARKNSLDKKRADCKQCSAEYSKKYRERNPEKVKKSYQNWLDRNKEYMILWNINYIKKNLNARIAKNLRSRIWHALKGAKKDRVRNYIGCTIDELRKHLENQFSEGMSWENYGRGGWHIDHIVPCSSFNLKDENEWRKCFHFSNLQPLWEQDNLRKGRKLNYEVIGTVPKHLLDEIKRFDV